METTFITIHDLSPDARTLYASDSIIDILGYAPEEVLNKPCWEFFHPDEIPLARSKHGKGVELDKAAVLSYCRMRDKDGRWLGCEVIFTIVYDVLVSCTSIYRRGLKSQSRAIEAPAIRRLFSSSPQDPRYHMLSHLSSKFISPLKSGPHEPRSALFLNRYTRTLTIMYATNGLADLLGLSGEEMTGKSFYYCIQESCLPDAVKCLENAKFNDSIAYLRFWFRDPRQDEQMSTTFGTQSDSPVEDPPTDEGTIDSSSQDRDMRSTSRASPILVDVDTPMADIHLEAPQAESRTSSGDSNPYSHEVIFGEPDYRESSMSSVSNSITEHERGSRSPRRAIELEAVVSCTSDGLVVCLRRATSGIAEYLPLAGEQVHDKGTFAVPWAKEPMLPAPQPRPQYTPHDKSAQSLTPDVSIPRPALPQQIIATQNDFMNSIREIGVFAWAVVGINGSLADYSQGRPRGESQPPTGLPVWQPEAQTNNSDLAAKAPSSSNYLNGSAELTQQPEDHPASYLADGRGETFNNEAQAYGNNRISYNNGVRTSGFGFGDPGLGRN